MSFEVLQTTLAADVATGGTFTVGYPSGTTDGSFAGGHKHLMIANQTTFEAPDDFTLAFNDTSITVTYNGTSTIKAGSSVRLQLDRPGGDEQIKTLQDDGTPVNLPKNVTKTNLFFVDFGSPLTADADGIAASQSVAADANFVIDGALAADGAVTFDVARNVVAAWTTTSILTITGTDDLGNPMVEVSASGTSHTGKKAFKTVTSVSSSESITSATVGSGTVLGFPVHVPDARNIIAEIKEGTILQRTGDYTRIPFQITEAEMDAGGSFWVFPGFAGNVVDIGSVVENTVTTGGTITVEIGGTAVDGLALVIADASSAGDVDSDTATENHATTAFTAAQALEIVVPAGFNASAPVNGHIGAKRTPALGTFVAALAVGTKSTGTTADVRGTIVPPFTPDGTTQYAVLVAVDDVNFGGNDQYTG